MTYQFPGNIYGEEQDYQPNYGVFDGGGSVAASIDPSGQLRSRSNILTDEGGYYVQYGNSLSIDVGTCVFTNGSNIITGTNLHTYSIKVGDYIKSNSDNETYYTQIDSITPTEITLTANYTGTGGSATGNVVVEKPKIGTGTTITITGGVCEIASGTTSSSVVELERDADYFPIVMEREFLISQRIANQTITVGFYDDYNTTARYWAWFKFEGTNSSNVVCESAYSRSGTPTASEKETTNTTLPYGARSNDYHVYRIECDANEVRFIIEEKVVARHRRVILGYGDVVTSVTKIENGTSPASSTVINLKYSRCYNYNKLAVGFLDSDRTLFSDKVPQENVSAIPVRVAPLKAWRTSFAKVLSNTVDSTYFTLLQTGSGHTVNQSAGNLVITSGTTANAETVIRSTLTWNDAWILRANSILSQRIANNNFIIEMVDVIGDGLSYTINSATSVTVTIPNNPFTSENVGQGVIIGVITGAAGIPMRGVIASTTATTATFTVSGWPTSGSGTCSLFGWNYHQCIYTSTTATNMTYDAQRSGWNSGASTLTINTTASPGHIFQVYNDDNMSIVSDALIATSTGYQMTQRGTRLVNLPAPDVDLYIQIRCLNGTTNPASGTTWTLSSIGVEDFAPVSVDLHAAKQVGTGAGIPVNGAVTVSGTVTVTSTRVTPNAADGHSSTHHLISAASTNATSVKGSAGSIGFICASNRSSNARFFKLYNKATAPTVGSDTPVLTALIPANSTIDILNTGKDCRLATGIAYALTDGIAVGATGAIGANEVSVSIFYT